MDPPTDPDYDYVALKERKLKDLKRLRTPVVELPEGYRVTKGKPKPPKVYFGFPVTFDQLDTFDEEYGSKHNPAEQGMITPAEPKFYIYDYLQQATQYKTTIQAPFEPTSECDLVLCLYTNFSMRRLRRLDKEPVIQAIKEVLHLDDTVIPRWYFDELDDPFAPK